MDRDWLGRRRTGEALRPASARGLFLQGRHEVLSYKLVVLGLHLSSYGDCFQGASIGGRLKIDVTRPAKRPRIGFGELRTVRFRKIVNLLGRVGLQLRGSQLSDGPHVNVEFPKSVVLVVLDAENVLLLLSGILGIVHHIGQHAEGVHLAVVF